jgi:hypothetical protein
MNISLKLTLNLATVLLFAVTAHVANSAPSLQDINEEVAPTKVAGALNADWEEARQIWNGVRTVKKQMSATVKERREAGDSTTPMPGKIDDYGLDNISVPTYVKELYRNLSKQNTENIDATTIRSLPAIHDGDSESLMAVVICYNYRLILRLRTLTNLHSCLLCRKG